MQPNYGKRLFFFLSVLLLCFDWPVQGQSKYSLEFIADLNVPTGTTFEQLAGEWTNGHVAAVAEKSTSSADSRSRGETSQGKASGEFGGISGIAYDPSSRSLFALSDSTNPTLFVLELVLSPSVLQLRPLRVFRLVDEEGMALPLWTLDPEGIALLGNGSFLIASEGYVRRDPPVQPGIFLFTSEGQQASSYPVPAQFLKPLDGGVSGVQSNRGFEGLSSSPKGEWFFVATEGPLTQDMEGLGGGGEDVVRILRYDPTRLGIGPVAEYFYRHEAPEAPEDFGSAPRIMGLSEIVALDDRNLLALERGFSRASDGRAHQVIRIFHVELPARPQAPSKVLEKRLVLDAASVVNRFAEGFRTLDNFEGMCLGPRLEDGDQTLLIVSDNNYSELQRTSFVAFRLKKSSRD